MKKLNICFLFSVIFIIVSCIAYASDFSIEITSSQTNSITVDEHASYVVLVKNNLDEEQTIRVVPSDPAWIVDTSPTSDYLFTMSALGEKYVYLTVRPKASVNLDVNKNYVVDVDFFSETTQDQNTAHLSLRLQDSETRRKYLLARCIVISPVYPKEAIDPREEFVISTNSAGSTCEKLDNIDVFIESSIFSMQSIPDTDMVIKIDSQTKPGVYPVVMRIMQGDFEVRKPTLAVKIKAFEDVRKTTKEIQSSLFGIIKTKEISFENKGNLNVEKYQYKVKKGITDVFNSYTPSPDVIELDDGNFYVWNFDISINETKTVVVKSNYTILAIIIVLGILLVIYAILTRDKIEVHKRVSPISTSAEGLSKFKVIVMVKNITDDNLKDIKLHDKIPHIAALQHTDYIGTVRPSKVLKHPQKGTILTWDIEELHPREERMMYYVIESKLNIIGNFNLPSAYAKIKDIFGRIARVNSNKAMVLERRSIRK
ncbi:MAG: hypothetical protein WC755_04380 [Candidatus Woesearchaeota archaeon]